MRLGLALPAILILAADTIPGAIDQSVDEESRSRFRTFLGYGKANYEYKTFDCAGNLTGVEPVDLEGGGIAVDYRPGEHARLSGFFGQINYRLAPFEAEDFDGFYGGIIPAWEGKHVGLGLGATVISGRNGFIGPSVYLRFGSLDGAQMRLEVLPPSSSFATDSWARFGFAWNQGGRPGLCGYLGVGMAPYTYPDQIDPRLFANLDVPLTHSVGLLCRVQLGRGAERSEWSASGGLRFDFGSVGGTSH